MKPIQYVLILIMISLTACNQKEQLPDHPGFRNSATVEVVLAETSTQFPTGTSTIIPSDTPQLTPTSPPDLTPTTIPTEIPTPVPIDPNGYQGWWTYLHPVHGFSFQLPPDWAVSETTTGDPLMNGYLLHLHPKDETSLLNIRFSFRKIGDDLRLWPTGVGHGEFVNQGVFQIAGAPSNRNLLVCPTGEIQSIWYQGLDQPQLRRGDLEFGFIYSFTQVYCQEGYSLVGKNQFIGDMIIASFRVPE